MIIKLNEQDSVRLTEMDWMKPKQILHKVLTVDIVD